MSNSGYKLSNPQNVPQNFTTNSVYRISVSNNHLLMMCVVAACIGAQLLMGLQREWLTFGTETDFLGSFLPDARRILAGEPLKLEFHPPLYSLVLAAARGLVNDWMQAGLLISATSAFVVLITNYFLVELCLGKFAAWSALFSLMISSVFLTYSGLATSDIFFFAIYSLSLLFAVMASRLGHWQLWLGTGLMIGAALLTRSNGVILLLFLLTPCVTKSPWLVRLKHVLIIVGAVVLTALMWVAYATATNSEILPSGNYANVALTYFAEGSDRIGGDARLIVESNFTSLGEVLAFDPVHMVKTYLVDLLSLHPLRSTGLFPLPFIFLFAIALFTGLFTGHYSPIWYFLLALTVLHVLLINLKAFEARYYLFIVPILAAPAGLLVHTLVSSFLPFNTRRLVYAPLLVGVFLYSLSAYNQAVENVHEDDAEIASTVLPLKQLLDKNSSQLMFARKPQVAYHLGMDYQFLPNLPSPDSLAEYLRSIKNVDHVYVFFGTIEQQRRPQYADLFKFPESFKLIEQSDQPGAWSLYEFVPSIKSSNNPSS